MRQSAAAEQELRGLNQIHEGIEIAIGRLDAPRQAPPGLTEFVRSLMANTEVPLTAKQILDSREAVGITGTSRRKLVISLHTVLKRIGLSVKKSYVDGRQVAYYLPRRSLLSIPKRRQRQ